MAIEPRPLLSSASADAFLAECARPGCRKEFRREVRPGRPKEYCGESCRRTAEKERRRLESKLARYELLVEQVRLDIAAHGRESSGDSGFDPYEPMRRLELAVEGAGVALAMSEGDPSPVRQRLQILVEAAQPVLERPATAHSA